MAAAAIVWTASRMSDRVRSLPTTWRARSKQLRDEDEPGDRRGTVIGTVMAEMYATLANELERALAADGGAVSRPQENTETTKTDEARSPSTATISRAGSTARAEGET